jgi:hypothetical protein
MQTTNQYSSPRTYYHHPANIITTTLYDLMEAVQEEVSPDEEGLVARVVADILNSGRIRFVGDADGLDVDMARSRR